MTNDTSTVCGQSPRQSVSGLAVSVQKRHRQPRVILQTLGYGVAGGLGAIAFQAAMNQLYTSTYVRLSRCSEILPRSPINRSSKFQMSGSVIPWSLLFSVNQRPFVFSFPPSRLRCSTQSTFCFVCLTEFPGRNIKLGTPGWLT